MRNELRAGPHEDIVLSPSEGDGTGRVKIKSILNLASSSSFPANPQEGDVVRKKEWVTQPDPRVPYYPGFWADHIYCYLMNWDGSTGWRQLD